MSKGALIYAHNTPRFNYLAMADIAAGMVRRNLGIPTTIVTDQDSLLSTELVHADAVIVEDSGPSSVRVFHLADGSTSQPWRNQNRHTAYTLSPYDQTIMLDSDYLVCTDRLAHLFDTDLPIACFAQVHDVTGQNTFAADQYVGNKNLTMLWATVLYWTRNDFADAVFELLAHIRDNYRYYSHLFNFKPTPYRNDFALTIAMHIASGYRHDARYHLPWAMASLSTRASVLEFRPARAEFVIGYDAYYKGQTPPVRPAVSRLHGQDLHVMNKDVFADTAIVAQLQEYINAS